MIGTAEIHRTLSGDATITAITEKIMVAKKEDPEWGWQKADTTILIYQVSPEDMALEFYNVECTVNCRAGIESDARALASAVAQRLNRRLSSGTAFFICSVNPVVEPVEDTDNFNVPVTVKVKGRL